MEQVINEQVLKENSIEILANYLNIEQYKAEPYLTPDYLDMITDKMFEGQTEAIVDIARWIEQEINKDKPDE